MLLVIELFGYLGSALVVISMLMSSVVKLRVINTLGSIISATYALIIGSFPLTLMNICLVIINLYNLKKLLFAPQEYVLLEEKENDPFLKFFLKHYKHDISIFFPMFQGGAEHYDICYMVCCGSEPAGVILGKSGKEGEITLSLEYTTPRFRDCSVGKYLYEEFAKKGVRKLLFSGESEKHTPYLEKMGYRKENKVYIKEL